MNNIETTKDLKQIIQSTGSCLREARERLGLTQQEVAERLCLKVSTVRDIENDQISVNLASTFLRGYIRSYAKLVNLPKDELEFIMNSLIESTKTSPMQCFSLGEKRKRYDSWLANFTWIFLFVIIGLTCIWWCQKRNVQHEEAIKIANPNTVSSDNSDNKIRHDISLNNSKYIVETVNITRNIKSNSCISLLPMHLMPKPYFIETLIRHNKIFTFIPQKFDFKITDKSKKLKKNVFKYFIKSKETNLNNFYLKSNLLEISFTDDCWLEVYDATGKQLCFGIQNRNENLFFIGNEPYTLKIGTPSAIKIKFQNRIINLNKFIKNHKTKHLIIDAKSIIS